MSDVLPDALAIPDALPAVYDHAGLNGMIFIKKKKKKKKNSKFNLQPDMPPSPKIITSMITSSVGIPLISSRQMLTTPLSSLTSYDG